MSCIPVKTRQFSRFPGMVPNLRTATQNGMHMNIEKLTTKSQEALHKAQLIAEGNGQQAIEPGHLLKAILEVDTNVVPFLLKELNINDKMVIKTVDSIVASYPKVSGGGQ